MGLSIRGKRPASVRAGKVGYRGCLMANFAVLRRPSWQSTAPAEIRGRTSGRRRRLSTASGGLAPIALSKLCVGALDGGPITRFPPLPPGVKKLVVNMEGAIRAKLPDSVTWVGQCYSAFTRSSAANGWHGVTRAVKMALTVAEVVNQKYDPKDSCIIDSKRFLWGNINTVRITTKEDKVDTVYVRVPNYGDERQSFSNMDELISFVSLSQESMPLTNRPSILHSIFSVNVISWIIALLLTLTSQGLCP